MIMVQGPSRGEMQDGIDDASREPEDEEDHVPDHGQDFPWRALALARAQAQAPRGRQHTARCHPLANLKTALLVRRASISLRVCVRDA